VAGGNGVLDHRVHGRKLIGIGSQVHDQLTRTLRRGSC